MPRPGQPNAGHSRPLPWRLFESAGETRTMANATIALLVKLARQGDADAARRLHEWIAQELKRSVANGWPAPDGLIDLLIKMHCAIGDGADPLTAMLFCSPSNRPQKQLRDQRIFFEVERERTLWDACGNDELRRQVGARQYKNDTEIFKEVARRFEFGNWRSVKNIYNNRRKCAQELWAL